MVNEPADDTVPHDRVLEPAGMIPSARSSTMNVPEGRPAEHTGGYELASGCSG